MILNDDPIKSIALYIKIYMYLPGSIEGAIGKECSSLKIE